MALISSIIKKYETEAKERIAEARGTVNNKRESLFLNAQASNGESGTVWAAQPAEAGATAPALSEEHGSTPQDVAYFDWQNRLIEFHKHVKEANFILNEVNNSSSILSELERLRNENTGLKEKLKQYESTQ